MVLHLAETTDATESLKNIHIQLTNDLVWSSSRPPLPADFTEFKMFLNFMQIIPLYISRTFNVFLKNFNGVKIINKNTNCTSLKVRLQKHLSDSKPLMQASMHA